MTSFFLDTASPVAVIGAGSMGAGIAQLAAQAGHSVLLHDAQPGAATRGRERVAADLEGAVKRGKMSAEQRGAVLERIGIADRMDVLAGCRLVIEAIVEKLEPKQALFRQLEDVLAPEVVFATNTSSISVTAVAQGLKHPRRLIGWHFFNPATRMKLVEIIPGVETDPALVPALHALSRAWGKTSVDAPNAPGFIVNRVARPYYAEALRLLGERIAEVPAIDRLLREAGGFAMGPFELIDLIGVDVNLSVTESVFQATAFDSRYAPSLIQQELVRSGRYGRKSGRGFYDHRPGAVAPSVPVVEPAATLPPVRCAADAGLLDPLLQRLRRGGVEIEGDATLPDGTLALGRVHVALTDGRTAAQRSSEDREATILLDLARDYAAVPVLGAAVVPGSEPALGDLAALMQRADIGLIALADVAGLVVMRTVCCLANEAADVMTWSGTSARDIDTAMVLGTAYPLGPLVWADAIGASRVVRVLTHLQGHYGDPRYRRAPMLSSLDFTGGSFHG